MLECCWKVFRISRFTILIGWYDLFGPSLSCEKTVAWWPRGSKRIARFVQQRLLVRFFVLPFLYISTIPIVFYNSSILRSATREEPNRAWQNGLSVCMWQSCGTILEATNPGDSSLRSTFPIPPIPRTSLMTIPSPLDLANNFVKNKHFSGSGGGRGASKVYGVHMNTTLFGLNWRQKPWTKNLDNCKRWISRKEIYKSAKIVLTGCKGWRESFSVYHVRCAKTFDLH